MALQEVALPLPFAGGLETQQDPKQVPAAKLLDLQNGVFTRATSISKRNGYRGLGRRIEALATDYVTPRALGHRDDELLLFADERCLSYRSEVDAWCDTGGVASVIATDEPIARTGTMQSMPDLAARLGVTLVAWEDSAGGVWTSTLETATGRVLRPPGLFYAPGTRPRCVAVGDVLHIYCADAAAGALMIGIVNPSMPYVAPTPLVLTGDLSTTAPNYDAEATPRTNTPAAIAWITPGGYRVGYVDASGVLGSPVTGHPSPGTFADAASGPIAVAYSSTGPDLAVVWTALVTASYRFHDPAAPGSSLSTGALQVIGGPGARATAAWDSTTRTLFWAVEEIGATPDLAITWGASITSAAVATTPMRLRGHGLICRAFRDAGSVYVGIGREVIGWSYGAVVRASAGWSPSMPVAARLLAGDIATGLPTRPHLSSVITEEDPRIHCFPMTYHEQVDSPLDDQFAETGLRMVCVDFDHAASWQTAQLGRGVYLAGSCPMHYDGDRWAEAGFHAAAQATTPSIVPSAGLASGALTPISTYLYRVVVEEIDSLGELHQGPASISLSVALTSAQNRVTWQVPTCRLTSKRRVRLGVFRTEANDTAEDPAFYRVSNLDPSVVTGSNRYLLNDPTVDTLSFVDDISDEVLITQEPLYTNGGIVSNDPAGWSGGVLVGGKSRLFFTDPSDPHLVRFSQEIADAYGVEFSAALSVKCDPFGGAIVALGVLDDAVIVFKESAIYMFAGPGPLANPNVNPESYSFTPPVLVTSDVGCSDVHSIGYTPVGLVFKSSKGVHLLGRDRQVTKIGNPVAQFDGQPVTRTTLLPDRTQILLLTDDDDGSSLLYDYDHQQWSRFTNHQGFDAVVVGGLYHYLRTDGRVFRETPGLYSDDNAHITLLMETAWIKFAGYLQGWQRIWWLHLIGTYLSDHILRVRWQLDYEAGWNAPLELLVDSNYNPSNYGDGNYGAGLYGGDPAVNSTRYQHRIFIGRRCQAIRLRIEDVETISQFGPSFEMSELLITGGMVKPAVKLQPSRSG
jgi:hypothetical protein